MEESPYVVHVKHSKLMLHTIGDGKNDLNKWFYCTVSEKIKQTWIYLTDSNKQIRIIC